MRRKLCLLALLCFTPAYSAVIFTQGPPNDNATNIVDGRLADDFSLAQSSAITGVSFWYQAQFQDDLSAVAYAFYADSGGAPGATLLNGSATPQLSTDGNTFFATFSVGALMLGPGAYWLELHGGENLTDNTGFAIFWAASDDNVTAIARLASVPSPPGSQISQSGFHQYAFELNGRVIATPAPEPATALPFACGLALMLRRRKRHTASKTSNAETRPSNSLKPQLTTAS